MRGALFFHPARMQENGTKGRDEMAQYILSRKGFDSQFGGHPSPILPDGTMLSLPIPELDANHLSCDSGCRYCDLNLKNFPVNGCFCHLDPDIRPELYHALPEHWRPILGQCGAAASHLQGQKIKEGDIFLFFGLFQYWHPDNGFTGLPFHAIWGYMQIAEIIDLHETPNALSRYTWHPHTKPCLMDGKTEHLPNLLFIGSERLSFAPEHPGYGAFCFQEALQLTIPGESRLTHWRYEALPWVDRNKPFMTYHTEPNCHTNHFQAACRGQEFVIAEEKSAVVTKHFMKILKIKQQEQA